MTSENKAQAGELESEISVGHQQLLVVGQCLEGMWPSPFGVAKQLDLDFNCPYRKSRPEYLLHVVPQKY